MGLPVCKYLKIIPWNGNFQAFRVSKFLNFPYSAPTMAGPPGDTKINNFMSVTNFSSPDIMFAIQIFVILQPAYLIVCTLRVAKIFLEQYYTESFFKWEHLSHFLRR